ncbi:SET domain-containing protein SmydA-8-like isoform X2 [Toxorhynchites rutilus septentrionalis]|uniref:SET domain-containing protein SmydA-8-like isoform X2 n=1 Tax=Toxorhynchites rutilus septentrionalis TaxID=329112 RepID=UPI002479F230|nr:SET domain-containing protein SmydA-8-like isoform X2 [Toxorhynchites rutilus septentrionalis]
MSGFEENFQILESEQLGRYVVANRDLPKGEQILLEEPYVTGPYWDADISCLSCFRDSCCTCSKCRKAPLCYDCTDHDETECNFYQQSSLDKNFIYNHFNVITPVRCLLLRRSNRARYDEMMRMEARLEERSGTEIWNIHEKYVVQPLLESGVFENFDDLAVTGELIQRICGILDVNTFEVRGNVDSQGRQMANLARGLYPKTALMTHSCLPNTMLSVDGHFNLRVYTTVPVKMGEMLHNNYTRSLFGTYERQTHLREGKYSSCTCERCLDPTELGTHLSSIRCTECDEGLCSFYPSEWECNKCHKRLKREYVNEVLCAARSEIMSCPLEVRDLEKAISKHSKTLNPRHALVLEAKQNLVAELRNICAIMEPSNVPKQVLKRKLELCEEILAILRVLEPGLSRLAGIAMYEYHVALVELSRRNFDTTEIKSNELLENFITAEAELKQAISMLLFEHPTTPEGQLTKRAMRELKDLREEIAEVRAMIEDENMDKQSQYRNQRNSNINNNYKKKMNKRR